ncbi:Eukaryotic peptide chain release factor subunit 1-1 [Euphorbia peplus]|nr:Eukaryotic peptide chain release factor subunit 1-1 [Euphorbia peplus]
MSDNHETDENIEIWKMKKLIKSLEAARGNGTSMISLIMPPRDQISRVTKMLVDERGTASNIKSRVNRQSVLGAITSAQQRLTLYNRVPPNGLVLYTGTIVAEDGKEKKVTYDFEPFRPVNSSLYLCDNKFHTEALNELLESGDKFGFVVMDGNGTLFGTLSGNTRAVLHTFSVDLPKKHGRGGQSALRFSRLRMETRHNYVRKTAELAKQFYINPATSQPNVAGLILAGFADFKTELSQSAMFDPRLKAIILNVVDVSYGGVDGFNQAIKLSSDMLSNMKFIQEERLLGKFFTEISRDTGKYVIGVDDTLKGLQVGAVETLIIWENLDINRYVLRNVTTGETLLKHFNSEEEADPSSFMDLEVEEKMPLLEWFANKYKNFGCTTLELVTNKSHEGSQFCRGLGGIGDSTTLLEQQDYGVKVACTSPNRAPGVLHSRCSKSKERVEAEKLLASEEVEEEEVVRESVKIITPDEVVNAKEVTQEKENPNMVTPTPEQVIAIKAAIVFDSETLEEVARLEKDDKMISENPDEMEAEFSDPGDQMGTEPPMEQLPPEVASGGGNIGGRLGPPI